MEIQLNGKAFQADGITTISQLLDHLDLNPQLVVVEQNHEILTADIFSRTNLSHGDTIEIVQFVGGG